MVAAAMTEKRNECRRAEDKAARRIIHGIRLFSKILAATVAAFISGVALIVSARQAWRELWDAFIK